MIPLDNVTPLIEAEPEKAKRPALKTELQIELRTMAGIDRMLERLPERGRARVVAWLAAKHPGGA